MDIKDFQAQWNELGADDPMWAVLTDPNKTGRRWKPEEFFATGLPDIESIWASLHQWKIKVHPGRAFDFGCGLGRLTQALCPRFERCVGVDISESMVAGANKFNRYPEKCEYVVNADPDLRQFLDESFDFVLSLIALQHTPTRFQERYVRDFLRILKPGGVAFFQVARCRLLRRLVPDSLLERYHQWRHAGKPFIGMYTLPERTIRKIVSESGAKVINFTAAPFNGERWVNGIWCLQK